MASSGVRWRAWDAGKAWRFGRGRGSVNGLVSTGQGKGKERALARVAVGGGLNDCCRRLSKPAVTGLTSVPQSLAV